MYLIDTILEKHNNSDMYVMYDIACTLQKHLKVRLLNDVSYHLLIALPISKSGCVKLSGRDDLFNQVHLCLPPFHSYGHKASCQVYLRLNYFFFLHSSRYALQIQFAPMRCNGVGMSDGEVME